MVETAHHSDLPSLGHAHPQQLASSYYRLASERVLLASTFPPGDLGASAGGLGALPPAHPSPNALACMSRAYVLYPRLTLRTVKDLVQQLLALPALDLVVLPQQGLCLGHEAPHYAYGRGGQALGAGGRAVAGGESCALFPTSNKDRSPFRRPVTTPSACVWYWAKGRRRRGQSAAS